jgi:hypothetical protein
MIMIIIIIIIIIIISIVNVSLTQLRQNFTTFCSNTHPSATATVHDPTAALQGTGTVQ